MRISSDSERLLVLEFNLRYRDYSICVIRTDVVIRNLNGVFTSSEVLESNAMLVAVIERSCRSIGDTCSEVLSIVEISAILLQDNLNVAMSAISLDNKLAINRGEAGWVSDGYGSGKTDAIKSSRAG